MLKEVFAVNVFGVVAVTQAMLPLVRKSSDGRIVNVSSGLGSISQHSDPKRYLYRLKIFDYDSSKGALLSSDGPTGSFFTQNMQTIPW